MDNLGRFYCVGPDVSCKIVMIGSYEYSVNASGLASTRLRVAQASLPRTRRGSVKSQPSRLLVEPAPGGLGQDAFDNREPNPETSQKNLYLRLV